MRVLVTGGAGYIGSHTCIELLEAGHEVFVIDNLCNGHEAALDRVQDITKRDLEFTNADIRDSNALNKIFKFFIPEAVIHFAGLKAVGESVADPVKYYDVNVGGSISLLTAMSKAGCNNIVFSSSATVYGKPQYLPVDEKHPLSPVDVNGINKIAGEQYHLLYNQVHGIASSVLRLTNTYGPRMRIKDARQTFLGIWIRNLLQGKEIQVFGDGKQRRDYNYVEDVLDALLIAAIENNAVGKVYNLGAPDPLSLEDTAKIMCHKTEGGDYQIIPFPEDRKAIDVGDFICDYLAFRDQFGWEPKVNFEDGILRSIEYFRREIEHYI